MRGDKMKKVSIIVPFYNVEEYIERSIKSLVNQSLKDIEIILEKLMLKLLRKN